MKKCDSSKSSSDHTSPFERFKIKKNYNQAIYHMHHTIYDLFSIFENSVVKRFFDQLKIGNLAVLMKMVHKKEIKAIFNHESMKYFVESCTDTVDPFKYFTFISIDYVTNTENAIKKEIDALKLEKQSFGLRTLYTIGVTKKQKFNIND